MSNVTRMFSWIALHWKTSALVACALGIAATSRRLVETGQARIERAERKREKELRRLADKISTYGRNVHHRCPTREVVVSERDLGTRFRKPPDTISTALNILLDEQKVKRVPLTGYWRLTG